MEPTTITEAAEALTGYWAFLKRRGRTASTIRKYAETLVPFLDWVGDRPLSEIKARDIEFWLIQWSESFSERFCREPSAAAQKSQVCALRGFFGYLERLEYIDRNPCRMIEAPKVARKPIQHLTPDEDEALLNAVLSPQERILIPFPVHWLARRRGADNHLGRCYRWADPRPQVEDTYRDQGSPDLRGRVQGADSLEAAPAGSRCVRARHDRAGDPKR
jgi:integrase